MSKTYKTLFVEKIIKKYFFDKYGIELFNEVPVKQKYICKNIKGLVDLGNEIWLGNGRPTDLGIEIKVSKSDLYAKTGHNHSLELNYLAVPYYLEKDAKRYLTYKRLNYVGLIIVKNGKAKEIIKAKNNNSKDFIDVSYCIDERLEDYILYGR